MPDYRRRFRPGGMFFFTVVTDGRRALFSELKLPPLDEGRLLRRGLALQLSYPARDSAGPSANARPGRVGRPVPAVPLVE
jgi:hypothetical protein